MFEKLDSSVQFCSVAQLCLTLCNPMNRSTPGLPVCHQLLEFTQTHAHQISDARLPQYMKNWTVTFKRMKLYYYLIACPKMNST